METFLGNDNGKLIMQTLGTHVNTHSVWLNQWKFIIVELLCQSERDSVPFGVCFLLLLLICENP